MRVAFTLFELVIVLAIVSLILAFSFPNFVNRSLNSWQLFENRYKTLLNNSFSYGHDCEFCVNFSLNYLLFCDEKLEVPGEIEKLILPGKVVSGELANQYCFSLGSRWGYFLLSVKREDKSEAVLSFLPSGESLFYLLNEDQISTLEDKVLKGRLTEWFSYYY